jgi:selenocysteine lyase/cysteine desulfurase
MLDFDYFASLREREFPRLDQQGLAYLDYTGSALYGASQVTAYAQRLAQGVFGNPHSAHAPSLASTRVIEDARKATLAFFDVDESTHEVCFTANASAAIKLVAESYAFSAGKGLVLSADNHNSVNGIREYARRAGAAIDVLPLTAELKLDEPVARLAALARKGSGLLAFPAMSNFSGVKHPLALASHASELGFATLLDAASFVGTHRLSLRACRADFTAISFYKMFGFPTGLGALIARREALGRLRRPWFAGGTVAFVSVQNDRHQLHAGHEGFEDGTPDFLGLLGVEPGLAFLGDIGFDRIGRHVDALSASFMQQLAALRHANGNAMVRIYSPRDERGGALAFNLLREDGGAIAYDLVEDQLREHNVAMRGGCFCNPGAAEVALAIAPEDAAQCFDRHRGDFSLARFAACLGGGTAIGAVRASFGIAANHADIDRAVQALAARACARNAP